MTWKVEFSKQAKKDAKHLYQAKLSDKTKKLLAILENDPYQNPPPYEKLSADLKGCYSRRINRKHRLVYSVDEESETVFVVRMWTHYE